MKKKKKAKKTGAPTKYKQKYCQALIDFFDIEPYEKIQLPHYQKDGKTLAWMDYKLVPARMPTITKFAKRIGVGVRTVYDWLDKKHNSYHAEFSQAFMRAKEIRKDWLIDLGLSGLTPPLSFKFVAINVTDMKDKQETAVSGVIGTRELSEDEMRKLMKEQRVPFEDAVAS